MEDKIIKIDLITDVDSAKVMKEFMDRNKLPHFHIDVDVPIDFVDNFLNKGRKTLMRLTYKITPKAVEEEE